MNVGSSEKPCAIALLGGGGGGGEKKKEKNLRTSSDEFLIFLLNKEMSVIQRNSLK